MKRNAFALVAQDVNVRRRASTRASIWAGADTSRLMSDWLVGNLSTDTEIRANMRLLRARARDLVKNNPWIAGFVDELKNNLVGEVGIMLQARVKTLPRHAGEKPELATATNKEIERGWKEWGHTETASANRKSSWVDVQDLAIDTVAVDGEAFIRRLRGFDNAFGYALQFVDADLVDENYNRARNGAQNEIRMGIELDGYGGEVGYHVWNRYSNENTGVPRKREFISADDMLHLFVPTRANATRGITWFAPILTSVRHLDGYEQNELIASRAAAAKMGFIINKQPEAIQNFTPPKAGEEPKQMDVEPGLIQELFPGQEFETFDPTHPSTAYEVFTSTVLRAIARGLRVSYLTLTGDLRQANYSSMRAGLLPERDRWRKLHGWMAEHFCRPLYRDWIRMALLAGQVRVDSRLASEYYEVEWKGRGWKWVDPANELTAAEKEIRLGINSRQRLAAERGVDFEETVEEIAHEVEFAEKHDVDVSGTEGKSATAPAADPAEPEEAPEDETEEEKTRKERAAERELVKQSQTVALQAVSDMKAAMESIAGVVERQAVALSAIAQRPVPSMTIAEGAIAVKVDNVIPAPRRPVGASRAPDGRSLVFNYDHEESG